MLRIESIILSSLLHDEEYMRKTLPFLKSEYFSESSERIFFEKVFTYIKKYNSLPSKEAIEISVSEDKTLTQEQDNQIQVILSSLVTPESTLEWRVDETEKFCKDKALFNAIMESIQIIDGKDKIHGKDALPSILSEALAVGFDQSVGHDYIADSDGRFEYYNRVEEKIPFDLEYMNTITDGGLSNKTLNVVLAGTGVGKSLFMCHCAAANIARNQNVLYITLEMAEERIAERIDSNLMNIPIKDIRNMTKKVFDDRIGKIQQKTQGKLVIKEYPTASAHVGHFRALLDELHMKKNFTPDIIYIDYLNICASSRMHNSSANSYTIIKSIAEEIRGLAVEYDLPVVTATQTTRGGYNNSDVEITDTSESFGLPATADLMVALIAEETDPDHIVVKQLKNRYSDPTSNKRFLIGVDRARMRLYDVTDAQANLHDAGQEQVDDSVPVFDRGKKVGNFAGLNF